MWQRIQTLYLAIVAVLSSVQMFVPLAGFTDVDVAQVYAFKAYNLIELESGEVVQNAYFLPLLPLIIALLAVGTIFLFKKRLLQIRLCVVNIVLAIMFYPYMFLHLYFATKGVENISTFWGIPSSFQLINVILLFLAIRAIGHDEALVRAADRMR